MRRVPAVPGGPLLCGVRQHSSPASALSQDEQALLKNKKYQQGLKDLAAHLPLEASKNFQESLKTKNLSESQKAIIRPFLAEALIRAHKTDEGLSLWEQLPDSVLKSYWTAMGLFNKGYFTRALEKLSSIPDSDPLSVYAFQLKAQLARQLGDQQLLVESLIRLGRTDSPSVSHTANILLADTLAGMQNYTEAQAILEQVKNSLSGTEKPPILLPYAELVDGKISVIQGNVDQAIKTFASIADNTSYPAKIRDLARVALAEGEILREKRNPGQAEEEARAQQPEEENIHTAGTGEDRLITFIGGKADSPLLMDAFNILLRENTFRTDPQALEKLTGWVNSKDATRQPAAMYAMGSLLLEKGDLAGAIKLAGDGLAKYPQNVPVQTLCLNIITALLEKGRTEDAERLISKYPGTSAGIIFQQGALAFQKGDYPWLKNYSVKRPGAARKKRRKPRSSMKTCLPCMPTTRKARPPWSGKPQALQSCGNTSSLNRLTMRPKE